MEDLRLSDKQKLECVKDTFDFLDQCIFYKDSECRYIFASHYWKELDIPEDDPDWTICGKTDLEIRKDRANAIKAYEEDKKLLQNGGSVSYIVKVEDDGVTKYLEIIKNAIVKDGKITGIAGIITNVTRRVLLEKQLENVAFKDNLTGCLNRHYLDSWLKTNLTENIYPLSVAYVDCNGLKGINDSYGHTVGDEFIVKSSEILYIGLNEKSFVVRLGGDEFLVVMPGISQAEALSYLDIIKKYMNTVKIHDCELTASMGIATTTEPINTDEFEYLISLADSEMYNDKVMFYSEKKLKK